MAVRMLGIHGKELVTLVLCREIGYEHIVYRLGEDSLQSEVPTLVVLLQGECGTSHLRIAEILSHDIDHRVRRYSLRARRLLVELRHRLTFAAVEGVAPLGYATIGEAVRDPYERYST